MQPIREVNIKSEDLCLILFVKNDRFYLKTFIEYYQNIGVDKFLIIDCLSEDGTIDYLMKFTNIGIYSTSFPIALGQNRSSLIDTLVARIKA